MSPKEAAYVSQRLQGQNQTQAAVSAGYTESSAATIGSRIERSVNVRSALLRALEQRGLTADALAGKLIEGTEAIEWGLTRDGEAKPIGPSWHARAKYVDMLNKVAGAYPDPRLDVNVDARSIVVIRPEDAIADPFAE